MIELDVCHWLTHRASLEEVEICCGVTQISGDLVFGWIKEVQVDFVLGVQIDIDQISLKIESLIWKRALGWWKNHWKKQINAKSGCPDANGCSARVPIKKTCEGASAWIDLGCLAPCVAPGWCKGSAEVPL